jgi:hypothetical protein
MREKPCAGCGHHTATREPHTRIHLHSHCSVPAWIAKNLRTRQGVEVPLHRIYWHPLPDDPYDC